MTACEVLHEGRWCPGELRGDWFRHGGRWRAVVRYSAGVGQTYEQARWAEDIRRPEDSAPGDAGRS